MASLRLPHFTIASASGRPLVRRPCYAKQTTHASGAYTPLDAMKLEPRFLPLTHLALMTAVALMLAACGGGDVAPTAVPGSSGADTATPAGDAPTGEFWRTDIAVGDSEQQVAQATSVLLADGSTATIEALAGGKPLLLYFYATW
jgi:hypothetical protein